MGVREVREESPTVAELLNKIANEAINKAKNDHAILALLDEAVKAESPMRETVAVVDMSSKEKVQFQIDGISLAHIGNALASSRMPVELRSLVEIADEIDQLLLLTDEQDLDTLALRKLKRALTRKHLAQVRDEILMLDKAIAVEMGDELARLAWAYFQQMQKLPLRLQY